MYLMNFADANFKANQALAIELAKHYGIDKVFAYSDEDLRSKFSKFYKENEKILSQPRGCGYWLWKPFLLLESLKLIPSDEVLMYCDCGALLVNRPDPLFEIAKAKSQLFFNMPNLLNRAWTKRDIFIKLNCDEARFWDAPQVKAQCSLWKNCPDSTQKLETWLSFCKDEQLITDLPSKAANFPEFIENRHDQSILSILVCKWGCEIFRDPSQEGLNFIDKFPNSTYGMTLSAIGKPK